MVTVVFMVAAVVAVVSAVLAVIHRDPVVNVLSLVVTFFCVAVNYALLDAHFLAAAQILVYAGAILVLFLFVIMLLGAPRTEDDAIQRPLQRNLGLALAAIVIVGGTLLALSFTAAPPTSPGLANTREIGRLLLTTYGFSFELVSVLLLAALVGAMVMVKRKE